MLLLIYSVTLLAAVLVSEHFKRTLLSSAVLFLLVGFLVGPHGAGWVSLSVTDDIVRRLADWALVTILFSDALHVKWTDLKGTWMLSGRALLLGLPLTLLGIALAGRLMIGLTWHEALLLGAILSPTDPVFASAIVGREEIPARLRLLLNVESGLNDGLALPLVILLMGVTVGQDADIWTQVREVLGGVAFGVAVALGAGLLRRLRISRVSELAAPLHALAVLLITYAAGTALHLNPYLAAFSAGLTLAWVCPPAADDFGGLGAELSQLLKLAAVLIFAVMLSSQDTRLPWMDYVFAAVVLTVVRFGALEISLFRSGLSPAERITAAWFGPKGFASVVYGLMLLHSPVARRLMLFQLVAVVIVLSILLHSSTDVPVAKYFGRIARAETDSTDSVMDD